MSAYGPVRAVLLDAYGTLLELDEPVARLRRELSAGGWDHDAATVASAFRAEVAVYRRHQGLGRDAPGLATLRRLCAAAFAVALPSRPPVAAAQRVLDDGLRYRLFPDVVPTLDALASRGIRCAVVSDWDCSLPSVLAGLGIGDRFAAVSASAVVGAWKPDPAVFLHALVALDVTPTAALHVGDDPHRDGDGARAAGMRVALLDRSATPPDAPEPRLPSLHELPALLG